MIRIVIDVNEAVLDDILLPTLGLTNDSVDEAIVDPNTIYIFCDT